MLFKSYCVRRKETAGVKHLQARAFGLPESDATSASSEATAFAFKPHDPSGPGQSLTVRMIFRCGFCNRGFERKSYHREPTPSGTDAAVVATGISHPGSTGPTSAIHPCNQMQELPMSCMVSRWCQPIGPGSAYLIAKVHCT